MKELGIKIVSYWTEEEDNILKTYYPTEGLNVAKRFTGTHANGSNCFARAKKLGIVSNRFWSDNEIELLKKYYPNEGVEAYKYFVNRTKSQIKQKADKLGLIRVNNHEWSNKSVKCVETDKVYNKVKDAADFAKVNPTNISRACKTRGKSGGYHWKYVEE